MGAARLLALAFATLVLLALTLTVAVAFLGLHRMAEYYAMFATVRAPRAKISDLFLFVAATCAGTNSMLTQTFFSHGAVALREGELVYLSETRAGGELMPDPGDPTRRDLKTGRHAAITPLLTKLKYYTGSCYVAPLSRRLDPAREEALKREAERLRAVKYPYPSLSQTVAGLLGWRTRSRHCFQHAAHLLDTVGLAPLGRGPLADAGFVGVCGAVCALPGRALPDGYRYGAPVQILYDVGAVSGPPWVPAAGEPD
jgi:hypothetical protein